MAMANSQMIKKQINLNSMLVEGCDQNTCDAINEVLNCFCCPITSFFIRLCFLEFGQLMRYTVE